MLKDRLIKFALISFLLLYSHSSFVFASEFNGSLSIGDGSNSQINIEDKSGSSQQQFTVVDKNQKDWDLPIIVKTILIGGVILEVIVLIIINFIKKEKKQIY